MKKILFLSFLFPLFCVTAMAQNTIVHMKDGTTRTFADADYPRLTFTTTPQDAVDMGLSVKWAAMNLDVNADNATATTPEAYGSYSGWGDPTGLKTSTSLSDYGGYTAPDDISGTELDLVTAKWGDGWRLPTKAEWTELKDKCSWKWLIQEGVCGYRVTATNGNSIFLPACGMRMTNGSMSYVAQYGSYWTSNLYTDMPGNGYYLAFFNGYATFSYCGRSYGLSVRGVHE